MLDVQDLRPDWYDAGLLHLIRPNASAPLAVVATYGSRIVLDDERELIDGTAAFGTACHGYNHPHIGMAVARQLERMPHVPCHGLLHPQAARLAARLARLLPGGLERVAFAESGTAAMERALAFALLCWRRRGAPERRRFLAFAGGWHGETAGALSLSDPVIGRHAPLRKSLPRQAIARLPSDWKSIAAFERLLARQADRLAGIVVEPLVQASGMRFHGPEVLARIRAAADRHGLLLIFDERFTGFGRTGTMFVSGAGGIVPDLLVLSGALAGGTLPLGAAILQGRIAAEIAADVPAVPPHGAAFRANPLACAAANASLDLFEREPCLEWAADIERQLHEGLGPCRRLPGVRDVRVLGAVGAVEFRKIDDPAALRQRFLDNGVFVRSAANVVSLTPPLNIEPADLSVLTGTVVKVLAETLRRRRPGRAVSTDQADFPL